MYKYLLVILEKGAASFCHYSNPYYHSLRQPSFMPLELLEKVIRYARDNDLFINFLYGKHRPSFEYEKLIDTIAHVKMIPVSLHEAYPDGVLVLDAGDRLSFKEIARDLGRNIILRVERADLSCLGADLEALKGKFKRLNLHLVGVERFTEQDIALYESQLKKISAALQQSYRIGEEIEINVLTDRMLLPQMNNCDAGVKHLTIAPNGKGYVCPAFYHDDEDANAIGVWNEDQELEIVNQRLLSLECAPICSQCDAFHCKRCVYLNKITTLEINVPSKEQCLLAHTDREISRQMLNKLRNIEPFNKLPAIRSLNYQDPFDIVAQPIGPPPMIEADSPDDLDTQEYLAQIYEMQKKILRKL